jgi:hypothetical protein
VTETNDPGSPPEQHAPAWLGTRREGDEPEFTKRDEEDVAILGATFRPWPWRMFQYIRLRIKEERFDDRDSRPPLT